MPKNFNYERDKEWFDAEIKKLEKIDKETKDPFAQDMIKQMKKWP